MAPEDKTRCDGAHGHRAGEPLASPASFLADNVSLLVPGRTLDLAAGGGRNAAFLADRGHRVLAVDVSREALRALTARAPGVAVAQVDLDAPCFQPESFDNVVCVNFLDRRLFEAMWSWLRPGGVLLLDTFLIDQRTIGHPRNPHFLLEHGELTARMRGETVLAHREGLVQDGAEPAFRSGIVAKLTSRGTPA